MYLFLQLRKKSVGYPSLKELLRPVVPLDTSKLTPSDSKLLIMFRQKRAEEVLGGKYMHCSCVKDIIIQTAKVACNVSIQAQTSAVFFCERLCK